MRTVCGLFILLAIFAADAAAAQTRAAAPADANRLICRRMPETGSLAQTRRQCFTRAEWDRIAESARRGAERTIQGLTETSQSN